MPVYPGPANGTSTNTVPPLPVALYPGDSALLFNAEQPVVGAASISVNLAGLPENHPGTVSIEGFWSGAPGNFTITPQTADTDADGMYQPEGTALTQAGATVNTTANTFRIEITAITAKFLRCVLTARANAVNLTLRVTLK